MKQMPTLLIDFDSTFVSVECLDRLAEIVLRDRPDRQQLVEEIAAITNLGMEGKLTFQESLSRRLSVIRPSQSQLQTLNSLLPNLVSASIARHRAFFAEHAEQIYIISGGFQEFITPTACLYSLASDHVLANTFHFDVNGDYMGYDTENPLPQSGGKVARVRQLHLTPPLWVIGDSFTDWQLRRDGAAQYFIAYTENVQREVAVRHADAIAQSFDEVLRLLPTLPARTTEPAVVQ